MDTRKSFLRKSAGAFALYMLSGGIKSFGRIYGKMKTGKPKKAAVIWYSQAGHTEKYGKCISGSLMKSGLRVTASDYRDFDKHSLQQYDLIFVGSPVYYYDVPGNFQNWIRSISKIDGIPVAGYVSFGGEGGNQHNTACTLLELMIDKGGIVDLRADVVNGKRGAHFKV
jgi:flavodoxin